MAKYGVNYYGASKYGATPRLVYSVEPMSVLVQDFSQIFISWQPPTGEFSKFRLVRNQAGFPETAEDGVIIFQENAVEGGVSRSTFTDGLDNPGDIPYVPGRQVYYRVFLFTADKVWVVAGSIAVIAPSNHGIQNSFMSSLPRVFTSKEQSPLGTIDPDSALYDFMYGLTFAQEEFQTLLDLLRPRHSGLETPSELIAVETQNVGLTQEPGLPIKSQKRLVREALYMYTHKGTKSAVETYTEALTGFAPTITVSENLMLTVQDSTFYQSTGNWSATNATLAYTDTQVPSLGTNVIDETYTCQVTATGSGSMVIGADSPVQKGVPVTESTEYTISSKIKSPTSAGNMTLKVTWYDMVGSVISTSSSSAVGANNTWKTVSLTATSPANSSYASIKIEFASAGVYYVDQVCFQTGSAVAYDEARASTIFLNPTLTNYINNPSFEVNATDSWTLAGSATIAQDSDVSSESYTGVKSAKITATGDWTLTSNTIPFTTGAYYTLATLAKTTGPMEITFVGRDDLGDLTGHSDNYQFDVQPDWVRLSATDLIDSSESATTTYDIVFSGGAGEYYLDSVLFERSPVATDYFDGSLPSNFGVVWEGTENNSYSHQYVNKPQKVPRLAQTLSDWMPSNAWWRISTYAGVEYTNLTV